MNYATSLVITGIAGAAWGTMGGSPGGAVLIALGIQGFRLLLDRMPGDAMKINP